MASFLHRAHFMLRSHGDLVPLLGPYFVCGRSLIGFWDTASKSLSGAEPARWPFSLHGCLQGHQTIEQEMWV
jgi:hypothetical protein